MAESPVHKDGLKQTSTTTKCPKATRGQGRDASVERSSSWKPTAAVKKDNWLYKGLLLGSANALRRINRHPYAKLSLFLLNPNVPWAKWTSRVFGARSVHGLWGNFSFNDIFLLSSWMLLSYDQRKRVYRLYLWASKSPSGKYYSQKTQSATLVGDAITSCFTR